MNQLATTGIVLVRTNYGEADRILTVLTPEYGKLRLIGRGVRRVKSKLAGGIELFSFSQVTFIKGRGEIGTLVSARLFKHYGNIVRDIERTQLGYELIRLLNKLTEDELGAEYFHLLEAAFESLNELSISESLIVLWFQAQLLQLGGHSPNLQTDTSGKRLVMDQAYVFDFDNMSFVHSRSGDYTTDHIKFLRLIFAGHRPGVLRNVHGAAEFTQACVPLVQAMFTRLLRI